MIENTLLQNSLNLMFGIIMFGFAFLAISIAFVFYRLHIHIKAESKYREELLEKLNRILNNTSPKKLD